MLRTPVLLGVAASLLTLVGASTSGAQEQPVAPSVIPSKQVETSGLRAGNKIRFRTIAYDAAGHTTVCRASVAEISGDTVVLGAAVNRQFLRPALSCPLHTFLPGEITEASVLRGNRGSRLGHAGLGALTGAVAGAIFARVSNSRRPAGSNHEDDGIIAALSIEAGTVAGGLVGVLLPAGERWERIRNIPPVRVAGLALRPGVRVAVGPRNGP
ncbi:MAG: hypothetical protein ACR2MQ_03640 [Gemmatimonadaceae bacterium]